MDTALKRKLTQAKELVTILPQPGAFRAFLTWKPFSITAFRMMQALENWESGLKTIVDVGANKGQFTRAAVETYPNARLISFEPLPDVAETLKNNLSDTPNIRIEPQAVGAYDGSLAFHRYDYSLESSPLPMHPNHLKTSGGKEVEQLSVPVTQLDTALSEEKLVSPCLLKLDVQGFELEVLEGATRTLKKMDYVLMEMAFSPTYIDQPLFSEKFSFMQDAGFRLLAPIDVLKNEAGTIVQMDALFKQNK